MQTVRLGSRGNDVKTLQTILNIYPADGIYGNGTYIKVKQFQKEHNLVQDGIVGAKTWKILISMTNDIYIRCAYQIGCEVAAFKAVKYVETGNKKAFLSNGMPSILFEGHVFWKELQKRNISPYRYISGNNDILYKNWTNKYYLGGVNEWTRLTRARKINKEAADASTSWGMFQIMGNNYKQCGCSSVNDMVNKMCKSEDMQIQLAANFIMNSPQLRNALINKQWSLFARYYNGPGYKSNSYDIKLQSAYNKYK